MTPQWGTALIRLEHLDGETPGVEDARFLLRVQLALGNDGRRVVGPQVVDLEQARGVVAAAFDELCAAVAKVHVHRQGDGGPAAGS